MNRCMNCSKELLQDEEAIYRRLVNRGASQFLCIDCLAQYFKCSRELIMERIAHFKEIGCSLFSSNK